jgi:hypothetical protein
MLLTPRSYTLAQTSTSTSTSTADGAFFVCTTPLHQLEADVSRARKMLLLHQTGAVKVGEVVRYTLTYTPSDDRILPAPACLHVRIRNTAALPLRAAYLHGPYTVHVAAYPATFHPNRKDSLKTYGAPEFEPNLKAGGAWSARLTVPEHARLGDEWRNMDGSPKSVTWIIDVASQIIFSNSASVSYELLVARDERSLDLGFTAVTGNSHGTPGRVQDHSRQHHGHAAQPKGVYSKAIRLVVDDTASLWNKPALPDHTDDSNEHAPPADNRPQKKIHLVVVTHGMHSNLGADMLYLKESIDATARQAREDRRRRRREQRATAPQSTDSRNDTSTAPLSGGQEDMPDAADDEKDDDSDEEDVIVRGFDGNVTRTERGIQYLGKRLAKHVLRLTYPDQPFLPVIKSVGQKLNPFSQTKSKNDDGIPTHEGSSVHGHHHLKKPRRTYKFTSISFIGHSLGGPVQTYAIAYIYKHSPEFFNLIKPVNFIALASPFLGLSNENPMYVKFALDFGLVGRTGQDLGLTWRAPTLAKSGWTAMVSGFGSHSQHHQNENDPGAKPLLRILPTGPAHLALRLFRNRTVYSNVVNDGIVPLRTSCLLFLDWRGIGKVEKARRENGLIGSVAVWGFGQLTGQNSSPNPSRLNVTEDENEGSESPSGHGDGTSVPLPSEDVTNQDDAVVASEPAAHQLLAPSSKSTPSSPAESSSDQYFQPQNTLMQWWSYIRPTGKHTTKDKKMFTRSQTIFKDDEEQEQTADEVPPPSDQAKQRKRPQATRGSSLSGDSQSSSAPPKTTIFESAGDLINPPVPPTSWITDPSTRARTIFHDRVYHPEDIPPPPTKKKSTCRMNSGDSTSSSAVGTADEGVMRVEEKIARAYHKDLSWRKVLVRLEPDAHNNIIVRRMFANAYGWPVIKHLCDTHFADTYAAQTRDEEEPAIDRAKGVDVPVKEDGEHVKGQESIVTPIERTESELREVRDELAPLNPSITGPRRVNTVDSIRSSSSAEWDSIYFEGTSDEEDEKDDRYAIQKFWHPNGARSPRTPTSPTGLKPPGDQGTSEAEISDFLHGQPRPDPAALNVHRGLGPSPIKPPTSPRSPRSMKSMQSISSNKSAEPDSLQAFGGKTSVAGEGQQSETNPPISPSVSNISEVGLRRSFEGSPVAHRVSSGSGVGEQVARMSSTKDKERP